MFFLLEPPAPSRDAHATCRHQHNTEESLWVVVKGVVMDLTDWLDEHPGGPQAIKNFMGRDATEEFNMLHDAKVIPRYAPDAVIGSLKK